MEIVICSTPEEAGEVAAARVAQVVKEAGPRAVLGVATGSSPLALYEGLTRRVEEGTLDLSEASAFALDEYVGLPAGDPNSYAATIDKTVTVPLKMNPANVHVPDGAAEDLKQACEDYEAAIKAAGGVDVQILGIGSNGHIGFNEPSSSLASRTRIKTLNERTREDNARYFASIDDVPRHCLTQGLGTIMDARAVVLVAQGEGKADAVAALAEGPVSTMCPGSILQMHRTVTVVVDEAAASKLKLREYYDVTYEHKPEWQEFDA
ncbi:glucosamine-6-phosphate deaminase [Propioniciclava coleopterorum]|uniref:Glucosamine-6-phosphate deaminase n=1 Tax=Propioniciclava coleopterorum TaxID=2714937 RepID=A0A6G7Y659_9ACTN|nr:glucosamine-6-phosphate deaminase [Propioniciclava coleopterorum]QIK72295.1 glucosamine-6-phosphate deaminase [Propioniciclava coleopterorum]